MFLHRLFNRISRKSVFSIFIELFLIITGVLSALAVENYRQSILEKNMEVDYLVALRNAVRADTAILNQDIQKYFKKQKACKTLLELVESGKPMDQEEFEMSAEAIIMSVDPFYNTAIFEDLKTSGHLQIISNEDLRNSLMEYYILVDHLSEVHIQNLFDIAYNPFFTDLLTFREYAFEEELNQSGIVAKLKERKDSQIYLKRLQKRSYTFYSTLLFNSLPRSQNLLDEIDRELVNRGIEQDTSELKESEEKDKHID